MEILWNKNEDAQTSPVLSTNYLPNSLKNWRALLLTGPWDSTAIGTNSPCDESPAYLSILLDVANSAAAPYYYYYYYNIPVSYWISLYQLHIEASHIFVYILKRFGHCVLSGQYFIGFLCVILDT